MTRGRLSQYKLEIAVAAVCGCICLVFLAPTIKDFLQRWNVLRSHPDGGVVVRQDLTNRPLFRGQTTRDAVEKQLAAIQNASATLEALGLQRGSQTARRVEFTEAQAVESLRLNGLFRSFYGAELEGADVSGLDFRGVDLKHANFTGANLSGARLEGAKLSGTCFARADLSEVQFGERPEQVSGYHWPAGGDAPGARFDRCDLAGQTLGGRLSGASFQGANLRGATFHQWICDNLDVRGADLTNAVFAITPSASPSAYSKSAKSTFYETLIFDGTTKVEGLRLIGVPDHSVPFVQWALARGAVLDDSGDSGGPG